MTLEPLTRHTITSKRALADDIEAGRQRGWFLNKEESQDGVMTLSSLFAWNGLNYIVTVAGPVSRIELKLDWMAGLLVDACHRLEMRREVA
jgi:DNA-binding IclR family transcriptional regulator